MAYAHAINLVNQDNPDEPPKWLKIVCSADIRYQCPSLIKAWGIEKVFVRPDGTMFEELEEDAKHPMAD
jgi:hypothetical protein